MKAQTYRASLQLVSWAHWACWCSQRFFNRPAQVLDALLQQSGRNDTTRIAPPFDQRLGFSPPRQPDITSCINHLSRARYPSTIIRVIPLVVIDPINRQILSVSMVQRPCAEGRETDLPFITNLDATIAIPRIVLHGWIATPTSHIQPHLIKTSAAASMTTNRRLPNITPQAPARLNVPMYEVLHSRDALGATVAPEQAQTLPGSLPSHTRLVGINDRQPAKTLPDLNEVLSISRHTRAASGSEMVLKQPGRRRPVSKSSEDQGTRTTRLLQHIQYTTEASA
jgi:hypothetical protein